MSVVEALRELDSCALSDALDLLGRPGAVVGLRPLWPTARSVAGRVRTVQAAPRRPDSPGAHIAAPLVAVADAGDVVVIANGGRADVSCWGGLLSLAARRRGIDGVIVDGACRDIADTETQELPIFGRAVVPVSARGRIVQATMDEPVAIAGVAVSSGDWVLADRSGIAFVADDDVESVIELARRIAEREAGMESAVAGGEPVDAVMHDSRFPTVQAGS